LLFNWTQRGLREVVIGAGAVFDTRRMK